MPNHEQNLILRAAAKEPVNTTDSPDAIGLDDVLVTISNNLADSNQLAEQQRRITTEILSISDASANAIENKAQSEAYVAQEKQLAEMRALNDARAIFKARGGVEELTKLATLQKAASDEAIKQASEVTALANVDIGTDGFFSWLGAQFQLPFEQEEADKALREVQVINQSVQGITANSNAVQQTLNNLAERTTTATIAESTEVKAQQAIIDAGKAKLEAQLTRSQQITKVMNANFQEVSLEIRGYQLGAEAEARAEVKLEVGKSNAIDDAIVARVQQGQVDLGIVPDDKPTILAMFKVKGESQIRATNLFNLGSRGAKSTPSNTLEALGINKPAELVSSDNRAIRALSRSAAKVNSANKNLDIDEAKLRKQLDNQTTKDYIGYSKLIDYNDSSNPNRAEAVSLLIKAPALASHPFIQDTLAPLKQEDSSPEDLMKLAAQKVAEGELSLEDAIFGISNIYNYAVHYNNVNQNRKGYGLPIQKDYNAELSLPVSGFSSGALQASAFGKIGTFELAQTMSTIDQDKEIINMLKPTEIRRALQRYILERNRPGTTLYDTL